MSDTITQIQSFFLNFFIVSSYLVYFLILIGFISKKPSYIIYLDFFVKLYVCGFLLYRFNSFHKKVVCTYLDKKIAFNAGVFLLTTTIASSISINYTKNKEIEIQALPIKG
jgi:hypothetical protein